MDLTGVFISALAPVCAVTCFISARSRPRVPVIDAAGADVSHEYRFKQQVVPLVWIFGMFSSSERAVKELQVNACSINVMKATSRLIL